MLVAKGKKKKRCFQANYLLCNQWIPLNGSVSFALFTLMYKHSFQIYIFLNSTKLQFKFYKIFNILTLKDEFLKTMEFKYVNKTHSPHCQTLQMYRDCLCCFCSVYWVPPFCQCRPFLGSLWCPSCDTVQTHWYLCCTSSHRSLWTWTTVICNQILPEAMPQFQT